MAADLPLAPGCPDRHQRRPKFCGVRHHITHSAFSSLELPQQLGCWDQCHFHTQLRSGQYAQALYLAISSYIPSVWPPYQCFLGGTPKKAAIFHQWQPVSTKYSPKRAQDRPYAQVINFAIQWLCIRSCFCSCWRRGSRLCRLVGCRIVPVPYFDTIGLIRIQN